MHIPSNLDVDLDYLPLPKLTLFDDDENDHDSGLGMEEVLKFHEKRIHSDIFPIIQMNWVIYYYWHQTVNSRFDFLKGSFTYMESKF